MAPSQPPSPELLDEGWALFSDDPIAEAEDDTRTIQVSSPLFRGPPSVDESTSDERVTLPPPVPVSEYVQTMMQQADDEPEPSSTPILLQFSWHGAAASAARRGGASELPASQRGRPIESWSAPAAPLQQQADDDDDDGGFTLIAFEPERLGDAAGDLYDPRFGPADRASSGFDELPFDEVIAASQRGARGLGFPSPPPVYPSSRAPSVAAPTVPPSSRRTSPPASIPPIPSSPWAAAAPSYELEDFGDLSDLSDLGDLGSSPQTKRGLAAQPGPPRAYPGTQRFGSSGDAGVTPKTSSSPRAPIKAPPPTPTPADPFDDVRELYDAGDFRSALVMAEALLETEPDNAEAITCAANCRETLSQKYLSRLGGLAKTFRVAMPPDEIRWLSLDHKAGFLLSCIDGSSTIEEVLDVACMQEFEAIRILHDFRELGVIEILPDPRASRR